MAWLKILGKKKDNNPSIKEVFDGLMKEVTNEIEGKSKVNDSIELKKVALSMHH